MVNIYFNYNKNTFNTIFGDKLKFKQQDKFYNQKTYIRVPIKVTLRFLVSLTQTSFLSFKFSIKNYN